MKIAVILLFLGCLTSMETYAQEDHQAIKKIIEGLTKGIDQQNGAMIKNTFRESSGLFATRKGEVMALPYTDFADLHEAKKFGGRDRTVTVQDLDVTDGLVASAKVLAEDQKVHYTYYLTFSKVEGSWLIQSFLQHSKMKE